MMGRRKFKLVTADDALEAALARELAADLAETTPIQPVPAPSRPIDVERAMIADDIAALESKLAADRSEIARRTELAEQEAAILAGKRNYLAGLDAYQPGQGE